MVHVLDRHGPDGTCVARVTAVIDEGTEFGARVAQRLREETVVWLTTVTPAGAPLPRPVGFVWDGGDVVSVYSQPGARVRNIAANPQVTLNFDGDGRGGDIVVLAGSAWIDADAPAADANPAHLEKYAAEIGRIGLTPAAYAARFSVPIRIRLTRLDGR
jgi:PPOX class probable F420-dependent enzyme